MTTSRNLQALREQEEARQLREQRPLDWWDRTQIEQRNLQIDLQTRTREILNDPEMANLLRPLTNPAGEHITGQPLIERPDMATNFNLPPHVQEAAAPRPAPTAIWPAGVAINPTGEISLPGTPAAPPTNQWTHSPEVAPPQAAPAQNIDAILAVAAASAAADDAETKVAEDPNSEEAKRKLIETRLQEIRSMNAGFGEVLMQSINLYPTHVEAVVGGVRKTISIMDFKQIFDGFVKMDTKIENMQMPYGTFLFGKTADSIQLSCYYPARRATIKHISDRGGAAKEYNVPLPNIIISHKLALNKSEWLVQDTHYFTTDRKVTNLPEGEFIRQTDARKGIYGMPFTNFYPEGRMCFGENTVPMRFTNNLLGLDYYYQIIGIAPFNNDLGIRTVRGVDYVDKWFKQMSEMTDFDYTKLAGYVPHANSIVPATQAAATEATAAAAPATTVNRARRTTTF